VRAWPGMKKYICRRLLARVAILCKSKDSQNLTFVRPLEFWPPSWTGRLNELAHAPAQNIAGPHRQVSLSCDPGFEFRILDRLGADAGLRWDRIF
jgi:hypothetical protein